MHGHVSLKYSVTITIIIKNSLKFFEQNNDKCANNDKNSKLYDHAKKKKKNTKLEPTPEPFYHNDKLIIINGGRFLRFRSL